MKNGKHVGKTIYTIDENSNKNELFNVLHNHSLEGTGNLKKQNVKKSE